MTLANDWDTPEWEQRGGTTIKTPTPKIPARFFENLHRLGARSSAGFSMPEVMVSSLLLAMVVVSSTQIYMRSTGNIRSSSLRDAVNARIAEDVEELRRESWRWACEEGTGCSGLSADADKPVAYKTGRCDSEYLPCTASDAPAIPAYKQACGFGEKKTRVDQTVAELMKTQLPTVFPTNAQLSWSKNRPAASPVPAQLQAVTINRTITVPGSDKNQLTVDYETGATSPVRVQLTTTLVPQALGWCP